MGKSVVFGLLVAMLALFSIPAVAMADDGGGGMNDIMLWGGGIATVLAVLAGIAAKTKTKKDDKVIGALQRWWKKVWPGGGAAVFAGLVGVMLFSSGCASVQRPDQTDAQYVAYEAGYAVGDIYILNKGLQNEDVKSVMDTLFAIIEGNPGIQGDVLDQLVRYQIARLIPNDQIRSDLLFVAYRRARLRIEQQLQIDKEVPLTEVLNSFREGLSASTGIDFDTTSAASTGTVTVPELTELLNSMSNTEAASSP